MSDIFEAVADPTRRSILERLRTEGELTVTEVSEPLPMSRQAVTKHLDILEAAGLVRSLRQGRERRHRLDPAPLARLDAGLAPYAEAWDRRLARLERHLEREG